MRLLLAAAILLLSTGCGRADVNTLFENYLWENRLVLVFAPTEDNPAYQEQMNIFATHQSGLDDRDIVQWEFIDKERVSVDGEQKPHLSTNPFYEAYDIDKQRFGFILIGKDGGVKHRASEPVSAQELFSIIDAMPMRQREMQSP